MTIRHHRAVGAVAAAGALALALTACGSGSDDPGTAQEVSPQDVAAALEEGGELLVWAWEPTLDQVVEDFEAEYPNVDVELANVGTGNDHYVALQNAIGAGSGVPDVAQVEYYALPQFSIAGSLADLAPFGASELDGTYSPGTWNAVTDGDAVYGLPMDSGPMALFYNAKTFEEAGVEVPATWDEFLEAARAIHEHDENTYILADNGDAGFATSMIWQAGGHPFAVDGTDVTVDLADEGTAKFTELWQQLIDEDLLADVPGWSDEWFQGLGNGEIAALVTGAWMPANLESGAAQASGDWRVAPMPQWTEGANETAENGGSSLAITEASDKKALAYGFLEYANAGDGVATRLAGGNFPATLADLNDEEFLAEEPEYFGGQRINEVLSASATGVVEGWQYLPYQVYANSVFPDTVGQAYTGSTPLADGLAAWQESIVSYGNEQGFTVTE
ncbi:ABC transporter substrate-binding protein [Promicromonospora citrea]|uniref:Sugar ABC transporter substrate-binding protein n=1 Tax=Promicromonospora citrea TaxID=43677 RepID=A0A8H9L3Y2_9MICO|nr:sugar ABC transporter substrate-binding protein [Promicromonospora citrea]NNH53589.1 sugar ABC transporter substrate-binding protein [Promicromonospora citrea]GGM16365.1 sugar ABC transporter substrate-binding protein [Promicromonospora citrea]